MKASMSIAVWSKIPSLHKKLVIFCCRVIRSNEWHVTDILNQCNSQITTTNLREIILNLARTIYHETGIPDNIQGVDEQAT